VQRLWQWAQWTALGWSRVRTQVSSLSLPSKRREKKLVTVLKTCQYNNSI
jgi:hypothetical protein